MAAIKTATVKFIVYIALIASCMMASIKSRAQIEVSSGIDMNYSLLFNKYNSQINYGQLGFGLRFGLSYKPTETQFFPTLNFSFGRTRLPLKEFGPNNNVATVNINYLNLMLNGNFVIPFNNGNAVYVIGGIGFTSLKNAGLSISGKSAGAMRIHQDSVGDPTKIYPAIGLGLEYVYGNSNNQKLYLSVGINVQYVYFFPESNNYYMSVVDNTGTPLQLQGSLTGRPFIPSFNITLHYLLGKSIVFWKKKDGRYL